MTSFAFLLLCVLGQAGARAASGGMAGIMNRDEIVMEIEVQFSK